RVRPAVGEQIFILARSKKRIEWNRHDAGADRAEKRRREIDAVVEQERDALLHVQAEPPPRIGTAVDAQRELAIGILTGIVDESGSFAAPGSEIAFDQI